MTDNAPDGNDNSGRDRNRSDEIVAECPFCDWGNLKVNWVGIAGEEKVLRCSYVRCGALIKSYQDEWPDHVPNPTDTETEQ